MRRSEFSVWSGGSLCPSYATAFARHALCGGLLLTLFRFHDLLRIPVPLAFAWMTALWRNES